MRRTDFLAGGGALGLWLGSGARARADDGRDGLNLDDPSQNVEMRVLVGDGSGRYRGRLRRVGLPGGRDGVVNVLSLEEYLYGVIPAEMPSSWPYAALEAQAIIARTFAMKRRNAAHPYDVVAGSADQEYHGISGEAAATTAAIDACAGLIALYNGRPASVAYMTCCGGYTDDAGRVWGTEYPYLQGVACPYCAGAPNRSWSVRVDWGAVARAAGLDGGQMPQRISPDDLGPGARPGSLRIQTTDGRQGSISTARLREVSGWRLPSTYIHSVSLERNGMPLAFAPAPGAAPGSALAAASPAPAPIPAAVPAAEPNDDVDDGPILPDMPRRGNGGWNGSGNGGGPNGITLVVQGSGSGHGIGLCQWGARGMAAAGATGQQIVAYYFPHTVLGAANRIDAPGDPPFS